MIFMDVFLMETDSALAQYRLLHIQEGVAESDVHGHCNGSNWVLGVVLQPFRKHDTARGVFCVLLLRHTRY